MHSHVSGLPHTLIRSRVAARFFPRAGLLPIRLAFLEKFDVAELECLRIDFQLGIRVLRWELKFNIDLRLELCLLLPMNFNITLAFESRGSAFVSSTAFAAFASRLTRLGAV
ncbi:MAG: hypothetical protein DMG87_01630 [Acidobacteria bacterium]|nr:MAG: hypothetical protein DMG87_01630 [Acidobacteriota bacterium]